MLGLTQAGLGWGHPPGAPSLRVEVPGVLPGELARVRPIHRGPRKWVAELLALDEATASPERVPNPCPRFLVCGGCQFLHWDSNSQLRFKRDVVHQVLSAALDPVVVEPVVPSPRSYAYRSLAKWVVGPDGTLGSYRPRSHQVTSMAGCRVHAAAIESLGDLLRERFRSGAPAGLRYVVARASRQGQQVVVTLVARSRPDAEDRDPGRWRNLTSTLEAREDVMALSVHRRDAEDDVILGQGPTEVWFRKGSVFETLGPVRLDLTEGGFSQVNPGAAEALYRWTVQRLEVRGRSVADLYAGSGGITGFLLEAAAQRVRAVESVPAAVASLSAAFQTECEQGRLQVHQGRVEAFEAEWSPLERVVVNPPRKGLHPKVVQGLLRSEAGRMVYVSCNPQSLARDLAALQARFQVEAVQPFDLFPHTRHVETAVSLIRRQSGSETSPPTTKIGSTSPEPG